MSWNYIVVGAGSAGCALTHELVRSGKTVLLIEAGGPDRSPFIKVPAGVWRAIGAHDWGYQSQPDPTRNGVTAPWPRGRVLGGSSSINGMVYVRGAAEDFDRWAQHCAHHGGWSAKEVMPIFRQLEHSDQLSPLRGRNGPLYVRTIKRPHAVTKAFVESACAAGFPFNPDYNGAVQEGVGYLQLTQRRGLRWSAADAFLRPIRHRKNLQLRLNATVEKIEVSSHGRARAVIFQHEGKRYRETADDVVVSAGAINTPKLLMLSGIGDPEELSRHKIDVVLDLPAVGRHLREHPLLALSYRSKVPTYNLTEGPLQKLAIAAKYLWHREGPIAAVSAEGAAFLKTVPSAPTPDVQIFFTPMGLQKVDGKVQLTPYRGLKVYIIRSHMVSSGRIRLPSSDPKSAPLIECPLLESPADVDTLVRGIETVRSIMRREPISSLIETEIAPGKAVTSAQALREYVVASTGTSYHPMGTCRMGIGAGSVVGPDLRVHGTENLWIADASVMPDAISANLNAPCMMIGAKLGKQLVARHAEASGDSVLRTHQSQVPGEPILRTTQARVAGESSLQVLGEESAPVTVWSPREHRGERPMMRPAPDVTPGRFDFGLSEAQEARAAKLHRESIIVDLLSQGPGGNIFGAYPAHLQADFDARMTAVGGGYDGYFEAKYWPYELSKLGKSDLIRDWLQASGLTCGTLHLLVHDGLDPQLVRRDRVLARYADLPWLRYVTNAGEIRQAKRDGLVAFYVNCQPTVPAPRDLKAFDTAYAKGLRSFMLTYNRMDHIGVGCTERVDAGLSMFGIDVVRHCNDIGIIVDLSHCGHLTTLDACRHSKKPVTANHTAARSLYPHARAKNNEALRAIADTGGVIGVMAVPFFLSDETSSTIEHMLDHIDYIAGLVGWQHVAIGTDWPLTAPDDVLKTSLAGEIGNLGFRAKDGLDVTKRLNGFDDCRDLPNITRGLVKRGYCDEQIRGILGENALRVFEAVCR